MWQGIYDGKGELTEVGVYGAGEAREVESAALDSHQSCRNLFEEGYRITEVKGIVAKISI